MTTSDDSVDICDVRAVINSDWLEGTDVKLVVSTVVVGD
jgi:hypothetical protein